MDIPPFDSTHYNPNIQVFYLYDHHEANRHLAQLGSGPQALGFDLEWKPNFYKGAIENPVALVQLANNDVIFLLQISKMKEFPQNLKAILQNPLIIKAGVSVQTDARKLYRDCKVPISNLVELSYIAKTVDNASWKGPYKELVSLARLVTKYEARELPKGKITRSNWEANLDSRQIQYASGDAHAGYLIYKRLESMINPEDPPESVWYSFNYSSGRSIDADGADWFPMNPKYDPGPPPPPRVPKDPKIIKDQKDTTPLTNTQEEPSRRGLGQQQRHRPKHETERPARGSSSAAPDQTQQHPSGSNDQSTAPAPATPTTTRNFTPHHHHHHPYGLGYRGDRHVPATEQVNRTGDRDASSQQGPQRNPRRRWDRNKGNAIAQDATNPEYDVLLGGMTSLAVGGSNNRNRNRNNNRNPSTSNNHPEDNTNSFNINGAASRNFFTRPRPPPNHANNNSGSNVNSTLPPPL